MAYVLILKETVEKNLHEFYFYFVVPDSDINPIRYLNEFIFNHIDKLTTTILGSNFSNNRIFYVGLIHFIVRILKYSMSI